MARDGSAAASRPIFPVYLLPSFRIPFRRRGTASSDSSQSSSSSSSPSSRQSAGDNASVLSSSPPPSTSPASTPGTSPPAAASSFPDFFLAPTTTFDKASFAARPGDDLARRESYGFPAGAIDAKHQDHHHHGRPPPPARRLARAGPDTIRCATCSTDLAYGSQIVSKGFTGRYGRAYLVSPPPPPPSIVASSSSRRGSEDQSDEKPPRADLVNIRVGKPEGRQLVTGAHVVADISCVVCSAKLGWKYVDAKEQSQKYKVGKFILETQRVVGFRPWEDVEGGGGGGGGSAVLASGGAEVHADDREEEEEETVEFDSEDEDECEDIFAGTWDARVVARRRGLRVVSR